ncbi:DNA repair protein RecN [Opitutales bacterium ASA1]|jgi:DNA repair protein RecN (Recombination protein N)|uniref:DNA repair protein RecN n=1 Tax=Congregicoccus parvus TaxID=3081749 RepID=UPI002B2BA02E|nr:DNA repair protein RecN [Opitutales bacterium ASA1]
MLQLLRIRNLALLEAVELEFESGFTAVTGETGAGKSILLGALGLLSGARADKTIIRQGADACEVEGVFELRSTEKIDVFLEASGLPRCEDGQLVLKRTLHRERAARIAINGSMATLANLQALGELWIDFHGPGEPRRLLKADCQIELLDLFGRLGEEVASYEAAYDAWRSRLAEIDRLSRETRLDENQIDYLRQQIERIDSLDLEPAAIEALERDFNRLSRAQELTGLVQGLAAGLHGDEGVQALLPPLIRTARELSSLDPSTTPLVQRLESVAVEIEDLGQEFENLVGGLDLDPETAASLESRMAILLELRRRHGRDLASIRDAREDMARKIAEQGDIEGTLTRLEHEAAQYEKDCRERAARLRVAREKAGRMLTQRAEALLGELGFARARLLVAFAPESELRRHGDARPEFLFSPNTGEAPLPLTRIASSGELARVMLALKSVLAEVDEIPVLVFDEVDANVGGEIGRAVGEKMAAIADGRQVFCVTHLPQVASLGAKHFVVEKDQSGARAVVGIRSLHADRTERIAELARMLGDRKSASALTHAEKLLGAPAKKATVRNRK